MYALCFYYLSPGPSRDQTMTGQALIAINEFMSRYPHSEQIENFKTINSIDPVYAGTDRSTDRDPVYAGADRSTDRDPVDTGTERTGSGRPYG